jgi:DNA topoisomerase-1
VSAAAPGRAAGPVAEVVALYEDAERCAAAAGLRYVSSEDAGLTRRRCGRGFSYRDAQRRGVNGDAKRRIEALAIPPAWRDVWICADPDAHLLATGEDERGRRQYLYHERWRDFRDLLNFYRVIDFGQQLPAIRADVESQLRRRTLDRDLVVATMLRIMDSCGLRVGNDVYAEENDSFGLSTLTKNHVTVRRGSVEFAFPAKSGKQALAVVRDPAVVRVVGRLCAGRGRRLFAVDGRPVTSDDLNARLGELTGTNVTAKDFRTWRGTLVAYSYLRANPAAPADREQRALEAIDRAAESLGNTRAVARAHYVHPHVVQAYVDGDLDPRPSRSPVEPHLTEAEQALLALLQALLPDRLPLR